MPSRRPTAPHGAPRRGRALALLLGLLPALPLAAQPTVVEVQPGQTLREIARQYLDNPDLWPEILRFNDLASVTQVRPGMTLQIPTDTILQANRTVEAARRAIETANREGAKLFAFEPIGRAQEHLEAALTARGDGDWQQTRQRAGEAVEAAGAALAETRRQREAQAEAILSDRQGDVQGRRTTDLLWNDLALRAILVEEQRVRTLSDSLAAILFADHSRIRLSANAQAVILRMRADRLTRSQEAQLSLVEGDLQALLGGSGPRRRFDLAVPGVETEIESRHFWAGRQNGTARFANYDAGRLAVRAQGDTVTLDRNQGTLVERNSRPRAAIDLLPAPEPVEPRNGQPVQVSRLNLAWQPVEGAIGYWLELAQAPDFDPLLLEQRQLAGPAFTPDSLTPGNYYWRVAAVDIFALPGPMSQIYRFTLQPDAQVPYLRVTEPAEGLILRTSPLTVRGETEPGMAVMVNDRPVPVDPQGRFETILALTEGTNTLALTAENAEGGVNRQSRTVSYLPDRTIPLALDPDLARNQNGTLLAPGAVLPLTGTTGSRVRVEVLDPDGRVRAGTDSDTAGRFRLNVPLAGAENSLALRITTVSGLTREEPLTIARP